MDKYVVIRKFKDLKDGETIYEFGNYYPRKGLKVSEDRIKELSTSANRRRVPLIKLLTEVEVKKPTLKKKVVKDVKED